MSNETQLNSGTDVPVQVTVTMNNNGDISNSHEETKENTNVANASTTNINNTSINNHQSNNNNNNNQEHPVTVILGTWALGCTAACVAGAAIPTNTTANVDASNTNRPTTASSLPVTDSDINRIRSNSNTMDNNEEKFEIGMKIRETPSPLSTPSVAPAPANINSIPNFLLLDQPQPSPSPPIQTPSVPTTDFNLDPLPPSTYDDRLSMLGVAHPSEPLESVLAAACDAIGFDIVELWLRTGHKSHQLIHSHLRYSSLDDTTRSALVNVYYGDDAHSRTHKLSPALCKKTREHNGVFWVSSETFFGAQALAISLSNVKSAVAVPVFHEESQTNMTIIYFSMKKKKKLPAINEFLTHMSLAAAIASVHMLDETSHKKNRIHHDIDMDGDDDDDDGMDDDIEESAGANSGISQMSGASSMYRRQESLNFRAQLSKTLQEQQIPISSPAPSQNNEELDTSGGALSAFTAPGRIRRESLQPNEPCPPLESQLQDDEGKGQLQDVDVYNEKVPWNDLKNIEYLTDGGNNWIHTAVMKNKPVVFKQLKPEVTENINAMDEIENEINIHSQLDHRNIVRLYGSGLDRKGNKFLVMERLDGGTLSQLLGYNTRIRDNRKRFFSKKNKLPYVDVLKYAQQIAAALDYLHRNAIEGSMVLHRDLKPDNVGKFRREREEKNIMIFILIANSEPILLCYNLCDNRLFTRQNN